MKIICLLLAGACASAQTLELTVVDAANQRPVPTRVRIRDAAGADHVPENAVVVPIGPDRWFACDGRARVAVPAGPVAIRVERGLEYRPAAESIVVEAGRTVQRQIALRRWIHLRERGYGSGENHLHVSVRDLPAMLAAEDLDFGNSLSWFNGPRLELPPGSESVRVLSFGGFRIPTSIFDAEVENAWGAVYLIGLQRSISIPWDRARSNLPFVQEARRQGALIGYQGGWSSEVLPDALLGLVDVVNLANNNFHRHKFQPRRHYSNLLGVEGLPEYPNTDADMMRMNFETYYRLLDCGLRLAAGAESATGVKSTPAGYNRAYVRAGRNPSLAGFLEAWRQGRNFVTNGPMLFLTADDKYEPGDTIALPKGGAKIRLRAGAESDQPLQTLEIVINGKLAGNARAGDLAVTADVREGAWIAARVTAQDGLLPAEELNRYRSAGALGGEEPSRLRFAHTSPIYVTVGGVGPRVPGALAEARRMLDAFERFARQTASDAYRAEILDALAAARRRLASPPGPG